MGLGSSNNTILIDKCHSLHNLTVTVQVTEDLITQGNNGNLHRFRRNGPIQK